MAESHNFNEDRSNRSIYPALAVAALAGIAVTYIFMARKAKSDESQLPVDKVVNLCQSAADKLDAFVSQAIAS